MLFRKSAIALGAALALTLCVNSVRAGEPQPFPGYYDGEIVELVTLGPAGVDDEAIASHVANPLYLLDADLEVTHVLSTIPGIAGYNPYWDVSLVTFNVEPYELVSEDDVLYAEEIGDVTVTDLDYILLCEVISE